MFCGNCGKNIKDGSKFCPYCGQAAAGAINRNFADRNRDVRWPADGPQKNHRKWKWILIFSGLLIFTICIILRLTHLFGLGSKSPLEEYQFAMETLDGNSFSMELDADISIIATGEFEMQSGMVAIDMFSNINENNTENMAMSGNTSIIMSENVQNAEEDGMAFDFYYKDGITYTEYISPVQQKSATQTDTLSGMIDYRFDLTEEDLLDSEKKDDITYLTVSGDRLDTLPFLSAVWGDLFSYHCEEFQIVLEQDKEGRPSVLTMTFDMELSNSGWTVEANCVEVITFDDYGTAKVSVPDDLDSYSF